ARQGPHGSEHERDEAFGALLVLSECIAVVLPQVLVELRHVEEVEEAEQERRDEPRVGVSRDARVAAHPEQVAEIVRVHREREQPARIELALVLRATLELPPLVLRVGVDERAHEKQNDPDDLERPKVDGPRAREQGESKEIERKRERDRERFLPRDAPLDEDEQRPQKAREDDEVEGEERRVPREARRVPERANAREERPEEDLVRRH